MEEADRTQLSVVLARRRTHGKTRPEDQGKREPDARTDFLEDEAMRDRAYDKAAR